MEKNSGHYYSQHGQDRYLHENFFQNIRGGFFVEVGAYDGETYSNTAFFERQLGWNGICIEPLKSSYDTLSKCRTAKCLNLGVSDYEGVADFCEAEMPGYGMMYSGLTKNYDLRHKALIEANAQKQKTYKVPVRRLSNILTEHSVNRVDYMSIDTEGSELAIIKDLKQANIEVGFLSIENNYRDLNLHRLVEEWGFTHINTFAGFDDLYRRA